MTWRSNHVRLIGGNRLNRSRYITFAFSLILDRLTLQQDSAHREIALECTLFTTNVDCAGGESHRYRDTLALLAFYFADESHWRNLKSPRNE